MLKILLMVLVALSLFGTLVAQEDLSEPITVDFVDLNRYSGLWYDVARIPNSFQDHCVSNTTAFYEIMDDGSIEVINSCKEEDGGQDSAKGIANVVDTVSNSKLEVSFVRILGINLFWGDYWILGLGSNYEYAVVGNPSRKYGWILSRKPDMNEELFEEAFSILEKQGYDRLNFVKTVQEE